VGEFSTPNLFPRHLDCLRRSTHEVLAYPVAQTIASYLRFSVNSLVEVLRMVKEKALELELCEMETMEELGRMLMIGEGVDLSRSRAAIAPSTFWS